MNLFIIMLLAAFFSSLSTYMDKLIVSFKISKKTYFFFTCFTIIPIAFLSLFLEDLRFSFSIIPFLLIIVAMFLRYYKQQSIVGILKYLEVHEVTTYMSLSILLAYIIDVFINFKEFSLLSLLAVILIITGVFLLTGVKLSIKSLKKDLIIRIVTDLSIGYVAFYILKYWSNSIYILLLNIMLIIVNFKNKEIDFKIEKKLLLLIFIQQIFSFGMIYLANYLSSKAVLYSQMIKPITLIITTLLSLFLSTNKRPSLKDLFYILLVVIGLIIICFN